MRWMLRWQLVGLALLALPAADQHDFREFKDGHKALLSEDWGRAIRAFQHEIDLKLTPNAEQWVPGTEVYYLPRYYLGLAYFNSGDCAKAGRVWGDAREGPEGKLYELRREIGFRLGEMEDSCDAIGDSWVPLTIEPLADRTLRVGETIELAAVPGKTEADLDYRWRLQGSDDDVCDSPDATAEPDDGSNDPLNIANCKSPTATAELHRDGTFTLELTIERDGQLINRTTRVLEVEPIVADAEDEEPEEETPQGAETEDVPEPVTTTAEAGPPETTFDFDLEDLRSALTCAAAERVVTIRRQGSGDWLPMAELLERVSTDPRLGVVIEEQVTTEESNPDVRQLVLRFPAYRGIDDHYPMKVDNQQVFVMRQCDCGLSWKWLDPKPSGMVLEVGPNAQTARVEVSADDACRWQISTENERLHIEGLEVAAGIATDPAARVWSGQGAQTIAVEIPAFTNPAGSRVDTIQLMLEDGSTSETMELRRLTFAGCQLDAVKPAYKVGGEGVAETPETELTLFTTEFPGCCPRPEELKVHPPTISATDSRQPLRLPSARASLVLPDDQADSARYECRYPITMPALGSDKPRRVQVDVPGGPTVGFRQARDCNDGLYVVDHEGRNLLIDRSGGIVVLSTEPPLGCSTTGKHEIELTVRSSAGPTTEIYDLAEQPIRRIEASTEDRELVFRILPEASMWDSVPLLQAHRERLLGSRVEFTQQACTRDSGSVAVFEGEPSEVFPGKSGCVPLLSDLVAPPGGGQACIAIPYRDGCLAPLPTIDTENGCGLSVEPKLYGSWGAVPGIVSAPDDDRGPWLGLWITVPQGGACQSEVMLGDRDDLKFAVTRDEE